MVGHSIYIWLYSFYIEYIRYVLYDFFVIFFISWIYLLYVVSWSYSSYFNHIDYMIDRLLRTSLYLNNIRDMKWYFLCISFLWLYRWKVVWSQGYWIRRLNLNFKQSGLLWLKQAAHVTFTIRRVKENSRLDIRSVYMASKIERPCHHSSLLQPLDASSSTVTILSTLHRLNAVYTRPPNPNNPPNPVALSVICLAGRRCLLNGPAGTPTLCTWTAASVANPIPFYQNTPTFHSIYRPTIAIFPIFRTAFYKTNSSKVPNSPVEGSSVNSWRLFKSCVSFWFA